MKRFHACYILGCEKRTKYIALLESTNYGTPLCQKHLDRYAQLYKVIGAIKWNKTITDICGECGSQVANPITGLCDTCESLLVKENFTPEEEIPSISETLGQIEPAYR